MPLRFGCWHRTSKYQNLRKDTKFVAYCRPLSHMKSSHDINRQVLRMFSTLARITEMALNNISCFALLLAVFVPIISSADAANGKVFREYIGAESETLRLADVPINPKVEFHFILSFLIDYTTANRPSPNNGNFNIFWKGSHFAPSAIAAIKQQHPNVRFAVSLGGDTAGKNKAYFAPGSTNVWLRNAVASLTRIIKEHHIDGLDIDYEHFRTNPSVFADCMGQLVTTLKKQNTISFASIAPFDEVQNHYLALWNKYGHAIDYVNFQFYAYDRLGVPAFKRLFDEQVSNYRGGSILASIISKGPGGLRPEHGFFDACQDLKKEGKLGGIFIWCADESRENRFAHEIRSQALLAA